MLHRVFQYAQPHARTRARIGAMPDQSQWRYIAAARDVDTMIQRMRDHGLGRWVGSLPRSPDAHAIEHTLQQGIVTLVDDVCRWLPRRWRDVKLWLRSGTTIALLPGRANEPQSNPALPLAGWLRAFESACPRLSGNEARAMARIERLLRDHAAAMRELRPLARHAATADASQWRLHEQLGGRLRALLGYESFHGGLLLSYALLELLQFERCRALLLASVHGWDAAGVV